MIEMENNRTTYSFQYVEADGRVVTVSKTFDEYEDIHDVVDLFVDFLKGVSFSDNVIKNGFDEAEI